MSLVPSDLVVTNNAAVIIVFSCLLSLFISFHVMIVLSIIILLTNIVELNFLICRVSFSISSNLQYNFLKFFYVKVFSCF